MSTHVAPPPSTLASALLTWIAAGRRDLPWRRRRDPYAVWVSEMMLQQTQVATVVPYFERWMAQFPDLESLANAPLDAVLKAWEGLGYYARARNMHAAARRVMSEYEGEIPDDPAALRSLPGIGRYTAGAILSLAFGRPEPVLDGNVRRVLCRVYDIADDPRAPATEARLWKLAQGLVEAAPEGRAGDLNEALMELGATVCVPRDPDCPACPLQTHCLARALGVQNERPARVDRRQVPHYDVAAAVMQDDAGRYLIAQRPPHGLLGGLWEFPGAAVSSAGTDQEPGEGLHDWLARVLRRRLGIVAQVGDPIVEVRHGFTHFRITVHAFHATWISGEPQAADYAQLRWVAPAELGSYAFPVTHVKILRRLGLR